MSIENSTHAERQALFAAASNVLKVCASFERTSHLATGNARLMTEYQTAIDALAAAVAPLTVKGE